jgi:thiol-disulfide isomerase/thioredoxin
MLAMQASADALRMAVLLLAAAGCVAGRPQLPASHVLGRPVDVAAPDLGGNEVRVADRVGQVRIVDFWATWCEPCLEQLSELERLHTAHRGDGLAIFAVSVDADRAPLLELLERSPPGFQVLWDQGGAGPAERLGIDQLPTTLVVDRSGLVRFIQRGGRPGGAARLEREVVELLRAPR